MSKLNTLERNAVLTHEGAPAFGHLKPLQQLRRSVLSCLLWEDTFYVNGMDVADMITTTARMVLPIELAALAVEARETYKLRHVPLLLCAVLAQVARGQSLVSNTIEQTIQRADELAEFLAVYAKFNGVTPDKLKPKLSAQAKKGLARAFLKFNAYHLGKYNRDGAIKLRDVLFLCHAKPENDEQAAIWKQLVEGTLPSPDTWEVALSAGGDKKEHFERLIREGKLGYLALLRNLRNMAEANCDEDLVCTAILRRKGADRVLPFRYVAAARAVPKWEPYLDKALLESVSELPMLRGKTLVLVDVSGSMDSTMSEKSDLTRLDAAAALASVVNAEDLRVFTFSDKLVEVPPRRGMAGIDAITTSQHHTGTHLGESVDALNRGFSHDRLIVISDEQSHDRVPDPRCKDAYMINVAPYKNGVGYGRWTHIDGFSENVLRFITEIER